MDKRILGTFGSITVIAQMNQGEAASDTLFVSFNHIDMHTHGDAFWGDTFFAHYGASAIGVMTDSSNWYPEADMAGAVAAILDAAGGRPLITYGNSHGGYGALKFSAALGARAAVAFCPQYSIDPAVLQGNDRRYTGHFIAGVSGGAPILGPELCADCYVIYDRFDAQDEYNVRRIAAAGPIIAVTAPFTPHGTVMLVAESGLAGAFLELFRQSALPSAAAVKTLLRAGRARSTTYAVHRAHYLFQRLPRAREALLAGLQRMPPAPRRIMFAVYLSELGRHERAAAMLQRADPALLARFGLVLLWNVFRRNGHRQGELLVARLGIRLHPRDAILRIYAINSFLHFELLQEAKETFAETVDHLGLLPQFSQMRDYAERLGSRDALARMDLGAWSGRGMRGAPITLAADGGISYQTSGGGTRVTAGEVRLSDWLDVETVAGHPVVRLDDGTTRPILTEAGEPPLLSPGWRPRGAYRGFAPYIVADLAHEDGHVAHWVLRAADDAASLCIIGSDAMSLAAADAAPFAAALAERARDVAYRVSTDASAPRDPVVRSFMRLSRKLRQRLHDQLPAGVFTAPQLGVVDLATAGATVWPMTTPAGQPIELEKDLMMRALHHFLHERFLDACSVRRLRWPALTQLGLGDQVHCVFFRSDLGALRCVDPATGILYHVMLMGADIAAVGVLVPAAGLIFTYSQGAPGIFNAMVQQAPGQVGAALARHLLHAPESYLDWLEGQPAQFASFTWPDSVAHLGHFLWNEASGLERILETLSPENYPQIINLAGPSGYEFYAPLENLYPEFRGRVNNALGSIEAMQDHCYANAIQPMRISGARVCERIRRRVMAVVRDDPEVAMLAQMGGPTLDPAMPVVVLGLRLSDRTHRDLGGFYARVIERLLQSTPRLTVVIDGLNARPGGGGSTFRVFSGHGAPGDFFAREKALVAQLRAATAGMPVQIIDCVGVGMRINLFWIDRAQMFIAPWGAGLVKYRWVCNKPGFVFSSRNNLTQPHHLPIYHLPMFMDDPAPIEFVDPALVTDLRRPGELLDADGRDAQEQMGGLSAVNFEFDEAPVLARIEALFLQTTAAIREAEPPAAPSLMQADPVA